MNFLKKIIRPFLPVNMRRLLRCLWVFNISNGLRIYRALRQVKGVMVRIDVPGLKFPVEMRAGTSDVEVFRKVFLNREYETLFNTQARFIIDAGANIGLSTIYFANKFPGAKIIAIEPESSNFAMLQKNTRYYPNITPIWAGLWPTSTYLQVHDPGYGKWGFITQETHEQDGATRTVTVDELLHNYGFHDIDIFKIDIEGSEKELFESNYNGWIEHVALFIIELHDRFKSGCTAAFYYATAPLSLTISCKGENIVATKNILNFIQ